MKQGKFKFRLNNYYRKGRRYGYRLLKSGYYENQTRGDLNKAWIGYVIAKNKWEFDKEIYYARIIRKLQPERGLVALVQFP